MKIALISDAQGNLPALDAVLEDAMDHSVNEVWFLGDFFGFGLYPEEVVDMITEERAKCIIGRFDLDVLEFPHEKDEWKKVKHPARYFSLKWSYDKISQGSVDFLEELPKKLLLNREDKKYLMVQGSPAGNGEVLSVSTPRRRFEELAQKANVDVVLSGESPTFFNKVVNGVRFLNPGSVGSITNGSTEASYALIEQTGKTIRVKQRVVSYKNNTMINQMRTKRFPQDTIRLMRTGEPIVV